MVSSRPTTVSECTFSATLMAASLCWSPALGREDPSGAGHTLVLSAGTGKDFRMSEVVGRKGQKKTVLSLAVSRKDVWLC